MRLTRREYIYISTALSLNNTSYFRGHFFWSIVISTLPLYHSHSSLFVFDTTNNLHCTYLRYYVRDNSDKMLFIFLTKK